MQRLVLVLAFAGLVLAACTSDAPVGGGAARACTEIGCTNGVTFAVSGVGLAPGPGRVFAEICFDGDCQRVRYRQQRDGGARWDNEQMEMFVSPESIEVTLRLPEDQDYDTDTMHDVSLVLRVGRDRQVSILRKVGLERGQPNGPDCPPICWQARIEHAS